MMGPSFPVTDLFVNGHSVWPSSSETVPEDSSTHLLTVRKRSFLARLSGGSRRVVLQTQVVGDVRTGEHARGRRTARRQGQNATRTATI
jgi:hypothetical protein